MLKLNNLNAKRRGPSYWSETVLDIIKKKFEGLVVDGDINDTKIGYSLTIMLETFLKLNKTNTSKNKDMLIFVGR